MFSEDLACHCYAYFEAAHIGPAGRNQYAVRSVVILRLLHSLYQHSISRFEQEGGQSQYQSVLAGSAASSLSSSRQN